MRVLVTSTPGFGHVQPILPLALELRVQGHDVRWVAGDPGAAAVVTEDAVRDALQALLGASTARTAAAELAAEIAGMPSDAEVAGAIAAHAAR